MSHTKLLYSMTLMKRGKRLQFDAIVRELMLLLDLETGKIIIFG